MFNMHSSSSSSLFFSRSRTLVPSTNSWALSFASSGMTVMKFPMEQLSHGLLAWGLLAQAFNGLDLVWEGSPWFSCEQVKAWNNLILSPLNTINHPPQYKNYIWHWYHPQTVHDTLNNDQENMALIAAWVWSSLVLWAVIPWVVVPFIKFLKTNTSNSVNSEVSISSWQSSDQG